VRKGHPVHFTFWNNIIQTKVMGTIGMEKAYDFPSLPQTCRKIALMTKLILNQWME